MNLEIRDIKKEDIEPIKVITAEAFAKGFIEEVENEDILDAAITLMFINPILNKSTFGRVATLDGEVIGVIFGSRVDEIRSYRLLQEDYTTELLEILNLNDIERNLFVEFTSKTNDAYSKLIRGKENEFQGCLEFFAVSEKSRGKKVGKKLLNELFSYFRNTKVNKIYVYTDTISNYGFYDCNGFKRLEEELTVFNLPEGRFENTNFIYEYKF